ncbi:MAG: hypothetical protein WCE30_06010 [Mycobacterium sp.]
MRIIRTVVVPAAVLMAVGSLAVPTAWADDPAGPYVVTWSDGTPTTTWTFTQCGDGCLHVVGSKGWKTDAHLIDGQWVMNPVQNVVKCTNGRSKSMTAKASFDPATLAGTGTLTYNVGCPGDPQGGKTLQFTLAPAPPPAPNA